jgi:hypothetical protein
MSSAAAMPLSIVGAEKNSNQPDLARAVIPATVIVHSIEDGFAVLKNFGMEQPDLMAYLVFAFYLTR